jgi:hypothetical protein
MHPEATDALENSLSVQLGSLADVHADPDSGAVLLRMNIKRPLKYLHSTTNMVQSGEHFSADGNPAMIKTPSLPAHSRSDHARIVQPNKAHPAVPIQPADLPAVHDSIEQPAASMTVRAARMLGTVPPADPLALHPRVPVHPSPATPRPLSAKQSALASVGTSHSLKSAAVISAISTDLKSFSAMSMHPLLADLSAFHVGGSSAPKLPASPVKSSAHQSPRVLPLAFGHPSPKLNAHKSTSSPKSPKSPPHKPASALQPISLSGGAVDKKKPSVAPSPSEVHAIQQHKLWLSASDIARHVETLAGVSTGSETLRAQKATPLPSHLQLARDAVMNANGIENVPRATRDSILAVLEASSGAKLPTAAPPATAEELRRKQQLAGLHVAGSHPTSATKASQHTNVEADGPDVAPMGERVLRTPEPATIVDQLHEVEQSQRLPNTTMMARTAAAIHTTLYPHDAVSRALLPASGTTVTGSEGLVGQSPSSTKRLGGSFTPRRTVFVPSAPANNALSLTPAPPSDQLLMWQFANSPLASSQAVAPSQSASTGSGKPRPTPVNTLPWSPTGNIVATAVAPTSPRMSHDSFSTPRQSSHRSPDSTEPSTTRDSMKRRLLGSSDLEPSRQHLLDRLYGPNNVKAASLDATAAAAQKAIDEQMAKSLAFAAASMRPAPPPPPMVQSRASSIAALNVGSRQTSKAQLLNQPSKTQLMGSPSRASSTRSVVQRSAAEEAALAQAESITSVYLSL